MATNTFNPLASARAAGDSPAISADPVSAILGSVASIWGGVSGLLMGQQQRKLLTQQQQLTDKDKFNAVIALSMQQQQAAAAKQRTTLIVLAISAVLVLGVVYFITRKTPVVPTT
jgi:hypothetical protein